MSKVKKRKMVLEALYKPVQNPDKKNNNDQRTHKIIQK